ncbi:MAG: alpha/beta hydrolase, partial [Actinobacteria bacterium]|nr:alpha/beta hydrolase [Actinomycetota bacterium]
KVKQGDLTETSTFNVSDRMDEVTCPVMIIEGIDDQAYTPEMAEECLSRLTNCDNKRLKLLEGYGHFIIVENPEIVGKHLDEFIRSL